MFYLSLAFTIPGSWTKTIPFWPQLQPQSTHHLLACTAAQPFVSFWKLYKLTFDNLLSKVQLQMLKLPNFHVLFYTFQLFSSFLQLLDCSLKFRIATTTTSTMYKGKGFCSFTDSRFHMPHIVTYITQFTLPISFPSNIIRELAENAEPAMSRVPNSGKKLWSTVYSLNQNQINQTIWWS